MSPTERKVLLLRNGFTVAELAREFGCLRQELSMCVNAAPGREYPHLRKLLAKKLKTTVAQLFSAEEQVAEKAA